MKQKTLQKGSAWEHMDIDNNGEITDGEIAMAKKIEDLEHQREMHRNLDKQQDQQRMMAWVGFYGIICSCINDALDKPDKNNGFFWLS